MCRKFAAPDEDAEMDFTCQDDGGESRCRDNDGEAERRRPASVMGDDLYVSADEKKDGECLPSVSVTYLSISNDSQRIDSLR